MANLIPKVEFVHSFIYDKIIVEEFWEDKYNYDKSQKRISNYIKKIEPQWRKVEKKVLLELSKVTGLKWCEPKIKCYVTTHHLDAPFSDPLTIGLFYGEHDEHTMSTGNFLDVLAHELIHQLFIQQGKDKKFQHAYWKQINRYKNEHFNVTIHILLHALLKHILLKYFGKEMLKKELEGSKKLYDYNRAWQIVEKEGYQNIISEFRQYLKSK